MKDSLDTAGSNYGPLTATDNVQIHQGNNYYNTHSDDAETKLYTWRAGLFDALKYDEMEGKAQQLDSIDAPTTSFAWVQNSEIPKWLAFGEGFFWISGKPGSGKSVLTKHLTSAWSTRRQLQQWREGCILLEFYFDFRSAEKAANDITGMLKQFVRQLCLQSLSATKHLRGIISLSDLETVDTDQLTNILIDTIRDVNLPVCGFVDGLDEYPGDSVGLVELLQRLQSRTAAKFCVASRPEPQLKELLGSYGSICMQDHNTSSLRVYVDRALIRARAHNPDIDSYFTEDLKDKIIWKSQGIMLWARLAVDQLLRGCDAGLSGSSLDAILDSLPEEVGQMYQRILWQRNPRYNTEIAVLLHILVHWTGLMQVDHLFGLWNLLTERFSLSVPQEQTTSIVNFKGRLDRLLGTLIDMSPLETVRLLHRTFHDYLKSTSWVGTNLPDLFKEQFPDSIPLRMHAFAVSCATADLAISKSDVLRCREIQISQTASRRPSLSRITGEPPHGAIDFAYTDLRKRPLIIHQMLDHLLREAGDLSWRPRQQMLAQSISGLPLELAVTSIINSSLYVTIHQALGSPLMVLSCRLFRDMLNQATLGISCQPFAYDALLQTVDHDLAVAIDHDCCSYTQSRLKRHEIVNSTRAQQIFDSAIERGLATVCVSPVTGTWASVSRQTAHSVAFYMATSGAKVAPHHLCTTMRHSTFDRANTVEYIRLLIANRARNVGARMHDVACVQQGSQRTILYDWVRHCNCNANNSREVRNAYLELVLRFVKDINAPCYERGTALHAAVDPKMRNSPLNPVDMMETVEMLLQAGAKPGVKYAGLTPYDYAYEVFKAPRRRGIFSRKHKTNTDGLDRDIIRLLDLLLFGLKHLGD